MAECHVCGTETDDYYLCDDCNEPTCQSALCGDGSTCSLCIGDEVLMADILDLEGENIRRK